MRLLGLILLTCLAAFAQVTDGVATSVTRSVILTADQADFSLIAAVPLATTQQQVVQILQEAGFPNLTSTGTYLTQNYDYSRNPPTTETLLVYQFSLTVPAGELGSTVKAAETLRGKMPAPLLSFQYAASLNASPTTVEAMRQTLLPQLFAEAQKTNDGVLLAGIAEKFGGTEAGEKAKKILDEKGTPGELVLGRDLLLEHPDLLGPDALDLDPRLLDGDGDNGELADGGVTLAPGELRLALRDHGSSDERVETRTLEPEPYSRARAAAQEVLYTRLLTTEKNPDAGRFERYVPFFVTGTVDPGGGFYVYPGVKTRKYQSEDQKLYE